MRIHLVIGGGIAYFPGRAKPILLDTDTLPPEEVAQAKHLVESAHFFELPEQLEQYTSTRGADYRQYTITVEDGAIRHTIQRIDPITEPYLQDLITFVQHYRT